MKPMTQTQITLHEISMSESRSAGLVKIMAFLVYVVPLLSCIAGGALVYILTV